MKKKIFSIILMFAMLFPCLMLAACGNHKGFVGKTLVYSKVEVEGSISKEYYETKYKNHSFEFDKETLIFSDGVYDYTYNYKIEKNELYIKAEDDVAFPTEYYAEISGKNIIVSQTVTGGVVKVYFKVK